jgi:micrococcal nuclease
VLERFICVLGVALVGASMWWLGLPSALSTQHAASGAHAATPSRASATATVVRLVDGDTLIVRRATGVPGVLRAGETRVRLLEIDTPESVTPGVPVECYGREATRELAQLTPPGSVVRVVPDRQLLDIYGRTLLYVWNARGQFVNLELVRSGAAEAVLYEPNDRYIDVMDRAEAQARRAGAGRWSRCPAG